MRTSTRIDFNLLRLYFSSFLLLHEKRERERKKRAHDEICLSKFSHSAQTEDEEGRQICLPLSLLLSFFVCLVTLIQRTQLELWVLNFVLFFSPLTFALYSFFSSSFFLLHSISRFHPVNRRSKLLSFPLSRQLHILLCVSTLGEVSFPSSSV